MLKFTPHKIVTRYDFLTPLSFFGCCARDNHLTITRND